jgi:hypothetical protein
MVAVPSGTVMIFGCGSVTRTFTPSTILLDVVLITVIF